MVSAEWVSCYLEPRRATEEHGEHLLIHEGSRRTAKNCNCNTFYPRRATKGHGELQLQHLLSAKGREGSRRTATATPFIHEGPRRATENCNCNTFCPRRGAKGREELQLQHLLSAEGRGAKGAREELQLQHLLSTEGHEGPRRTATATPFVREGARRELQLNGGPRRTATATSFAGGGPLRTPF